MPQIAPFSDQAIAAAAGLLAEGRVVAFATETVYGLGADTFNVAALDHLYAVKGRQQDNPLIAHVADAVVAKRIAATWDRRAEALARRFWPGPLTLVVPKAAEVPDRATAGWPTIAVRAPDHPVAMGILEAFGGPVSAASANRSGRISPTRAEHVAQDLADVEDLTILDGGPCSVGIESTVVDLTRLPAVVLRPGSVSSEHLREVIGEVVTAESGGQDASPGTSARHYAPQTPAEIVGGHTLAARLSGLDTTAAVMVHSTTMIPSPHVAIVMPPEAGPYAECLYDALREADAAGAARIVIEAPPANDGLWAAIHDRLRRATA